MPDDVLLSIYGTIQCLETELCCPSSEKKRKALRTASTPARPSPPASWKMPTPTSGPTSTKLTSAARLATSVSLTPDAGKVPPARAPGYQAVVAAPPRSYTSTALLARGQVVASNVVILFGRGGPVQFGPVIADRGRTRALRAARASGRPALFTPECLYLRLRFPKSSTCPLHSPLFPSYSPPLARYRLRQC